jgi:hypothetical protein
MILGTPVCFMYRMVRWYLTARKNMAWHPSIPLIPIADSFSKSETESDLIPWVDDISDDGIDYIPAGPEIETPKLEDSERDEVQIF